MPCLLHRRARVGLPVLAAMVVLGAGATAAYAADPTITLGGGQLTITGDDPANTVALRLKAGDDTHLEVDFRDDGTADSTIARSGVDHIDIDTNGGDDTIRIDDANGV